MNVDRELDWQALSSDWQALERPLPAASLEQLAARVRARGRVLALWAIGETVIAAVALVVLTRLALNADRLSDQLAMWSLTVIAAATTAFGLWNWRGTWAPVAASQQAYVDLSLARCARLRRGAVAGYLVLAAEVACFVPWIASVLITNDAGWLGYAGAYLYLAVFVAGALFVLGRVRRWIARDERAVRAFSDTLNEI